MTEAGALHTTTIGDRGSRVVFAHGLFGQGRNWTQIGKALADHHRVLLVERIQAVLPREQHPGGQRHHEREVLGVST